MSNIVKYARGFVAFNHIIPAFAFASRAGACQSGASLPCYELLGKCDCNEVARKQCSCNIYRRNCVSMEEYQRKQSAGWQLLSQLKASAFSL
jgi:hypothetical protein